ncbi:MAG: hypothetical protein AB1921_18530 [Thermodesulfobacteriota bacterium]
MKKALFALIFASFLLTAPAALAEPCVVQKGCILSWGVGYPPAKFKESGRAAAMAERAAQVAAMKNLMACLASQGRKPPEESGANTGELPPWVKVAGVARLADGSVMVTLSYCP